MWSAGCILGELLAHKPLLPGRSEINQLEIIIDLLGTPNAQIWPEIEDLPTLKDFTLKIQRKLMIKLMIFSIQKLSCEKHLSFFFFYFISLRIYIKYVIFVISYNIFFSIRGSLDGEVPDRMCSTWIYVNGGRRVSSSWGYYESHDISAPLSIVLISTWSSIPSSPLLKVE